MKSSSHELLKQELVMKQTIINELNNQILQLEQKINWLEGEIQELQEFSERGEIKE